MDEESPKEAPEAETGNPEESEEKEIKPFIFGDEELSDVTLLVEGTPFKVHKMVLASRSDYFKTMFSDKFKEGKQKEVEIKALSSETFRRLLELLYTGVISDANVFLISPKENKCNSANTVVACPGEQFTLDNFSYHAITANPIAEKEKDFITNFWKITQSLVTTADRFNISALVESYFERTIANDICGRRNCFYCFNSYIFGLNQGWKLPQTNKMYDKNNWNTWISHAESAAFVENLSLAVIAECLKRT